jgi:hypothetical protein
MFCHVLFRTWTQEECEFEMPARNSGPSTPLPQKKTVLSNVLQIVLMQKNGIFSTIQDGTYTPMNSGM